MANSQTCYQIGIVNEHKQTKHTFIISTPSTFLILDKYLGRNCMRDFQLSKLNKSAVKFFLKILHKVYIHNDYTSDYHKCM